MVEVTHTAWRELLHKIGLLPVADILEKYGIASSIDVSELKQDDGSWGLVTTDTLVDRSRTMCQKYRTCARPLL
jgi:hypothetical protein